MIQLDITSIKNTPGEVQNVEQFFSLGEIKSQHGLITFDSPVMLKGTLSNEAGILVLSGYLQGDVSVLCGRCLEPFKLTINTEIDEFYYSELINGEEPGEEWVKFKGNKLDVSGELIKSILADLPMKILCSQDCKGLCPICGINRNQGKCSCANDDIDPRLELLKKLLD